MANRAPRQRLEGGDDQCVPGQYGQWLPEGDMHGGLLSAHRRIVEARQIVMHERSAMEEFDRGSGSVGGGFVVIAAGSRDGQAQPRPDAVAAGKHRVADRLCQTRRRAGGLAVSDRCIESRFDPSAGIHRATP
ncbi:hypothetical protein GCM10007884_42960 [Methylobacterium brachythecii]|uniref:Uncharacterized protein n=1 Tax=Methylobacterium brachythecii TaxID=1176177 RepID=A0ABQ6D7I0_9HYPH|nr:hypothetical protein GCM10007884_42960 [Methylobacterium brachythecii]